ncbi:hypothetical protein H6P81_009484 [Aristolochia fimbriata]|uniref:Homologous recombination OB-fold protein OB-fold domain-containing protein n=1 Tax=Aristolochia fimbriata TaxID=158543 RepID=A0AAV7EL91_ARIFI|nr:hypothetical protein H6P81_009484 [Aristolochia fimbriata]
MDSTDSWEALDVDDSDLSAFLPLPSLRPCASRSSPPSQPSLNSSQDSLPLLRPCSQLRGSSQGALPNQDLPSRQTPPPQVPVRTQTRVLPAVPDENRCPQFPLKRRIPGPAGIVQAAIHRQDIEAEDETGPCVVRMSQLENGVDDEDFKKSAWLCALDFLGAEPDLAAKATLLCSLKTSQRTERVPKVVAIIKSCKPNGLGDLIVTLRDPSATVGATIHRKVLSESKFSKDISVGSVIVLEQVVVFCSFGSARYLNVTMENVVQVFNAESTAPRPKRKYPLFPERYTDNGGSRVGKEAITSAGKRLNGAANEEVTREPTVEGAIERRPKEGAVGTSFCSKVMFCNDGTQGEETNHERDNGKKKLISGVSHTNWTDEQLSELFADFEDC